MSAQAVFIEELEKTILLLRKELCAADDRSFEWVKQLNEARTRLKIAERVHDRDLRLCRSNLKLARIRIAELMGVLKNR